MRRLLLAGTILAAAGAGPAAARLQLSISDGANTVSCFDGELGCDSSGGANNLLIFNTVFPDGDLVQLTLTLSTFGKHNVLQLSSSNIESVGGGPIIFVASDNSFTSPVTSINESGSLTFNQNISATDSFLKFWADGANVQGANPTNTPGTLLDTVSGHATTDPQSFSGSKISAFIANSPFSMTEGATLNLIPGGSITGFQESMTSSAAIPEPSTWALSLLGFGLLGLAGLGKRRLAAY